MAQIFKSKDLTFAVPEKESDEQRINCVAGTFHASTAICTIQCTCTAHTIYCTVHTLYCTLYSCTVHTITVCTFGSNTITITPTTGCTGSVTDPTPIENEISKITDAETLKTLNDKLFKSLEEVKARQAELSKKK
jgi:hypothetical protein